MRSQASIICSACAVSIDVGRREPEVQPARGGTDVLGHGGRERDNVVLRDLFDLFDARDVESRLGSQLASPHPRARCRHPPSHRQPRVRPGARFRTCAGRSRCGPSPGACSGESSERELLLLDLQAVDVAEHGHAERAVRKKLARQPRNVVAS